ncbi:MAG: right-handed parallel beta-helix repeat-containing protein [Ignavibacteriae bacterium]|nr:right-handed parallel beta-helix repeat-containing protein [Ignavibacteriota bacterium]
MQAVSQPSGGPYGPMRQTYELPKGAVKIYYVAVEGKSEAAGVALSTPTTLEAAIERVKTGDAIVMRGGEYRTGNLVFNQGITIQPYKDEKPVLKGTLVAESWTNLGNGLWTTKWSKLFPTKPADWWRRNREGKTTPLHRFNNDMVFIDGKFLQSAGWEGEVDENSFYIDYDAGLVYIGVDPKDRLVEITAFDVALLRTTKEAHGKKSDRNGYTIRGITFTQYAYRALEVEGTEPEGISDESKHGKEVVGTTLEDCTISFCSRVAGYFRGDHMTIRRCKVTDTSTEGVYVIASNDVLLEKNIFTRNNIENITGYYPAAVKIFNQSYRVTCRDNLVIDLPNSNGIWYDVGNVDGVFVNNWVEGVGRNDRPISTTNLWPSDNGFFFEISKGCIVAGNVFLNCDHGMMILNSSNVQVYQNTFLNSMACIGRNARSAVGDHFGWHPSTGPDVDAREGHVFVNNLLVGEKEFERPLFFAWQAESLCKQLTQSQLKQLDNNTFVRASGKESPLILWSPSAGEKCLMAYNSTDALLRDHAGFATSNRSYLGYDGPLFKGAVLKDFRPLRSFVGSRSEKSSPNAIFRLVGESKMDAAYVGAYPASSEGRE